MRKFVGFAGLALVAVSVAAVGPAGAAADFTPNPTYQADDSGRGQIMSILPAGENGLVNSAQLLAFESSGSRPAGSQDQLTKYANLLYGYPSLSNAQLPQYYDDASFGVRAADIVRTEQPSPDVVIYRDRHDVPHIYGRTLTGTAFGAGYAAAEDRLFLIDVLRHYGAGDLSAFLGPSCSDERMDHDELLSAPYTQPQEQAQIDAIAASNGIVGTDLKSMLTGYVDGINAYIAATRTNPALLPADYAAAVGPPQPWIPSDVISVAALVGGIFGKGGGNELANARLLQYLESHLHSAAEARTAFTDFREQNDPNAPTTIVDRSFPYEIPGKIDPALTALPDPNTPLTGGPTDTTANCNLTAPNLTAMKIVAALLSFPKAMSNALVVAGSHTASGHPIAVFGPQVGYFAPEILMEEDLHGPDYAAEGASFPGTNFVVELGRGVDYAWSATSAGTDVVDQRVELVCNPNGGAAGPHGTFYEYKGRCLPMTHEVFTELAFPKPGGLGAPVDLRHDIYLTVHGIVQGWTTVGGKPVAIVTQRSTYNHEADSAVGFFRWNSPSYTTSAQTWMTGAEHIGYTFNWLYADSRDIAYYVSGADPIRPAGVDPSLPTWGTGGADWKGFLSDAGHPHEIDPPQGFFTSWNNKPAPEFSAADDQFGYGPIYRVMSLTTAIKQQFALHNNKITRANLVQAMEDAATVDLSGRRVLPELLGYLASPGAGTQTQELSELSAWLAAGAHRRRAAHGDAQYVDASAVALMDELYPTLIEAIFDPILKAGGVEDVNGLPYRYSVLPLDFANTPGGSNVGSAYDGGWEGYLVKVLRQLRGEPVAQPFGPEIMTRICGGGAASCRAAIDGALSATYSAMVSANGSPTVASWTRSTASEQAGVSQPVYDSIHYTAVGIVGQPAQDWQNRPTFQQVIEFPGSGPSGAARARIGAVSSSSASLPATGEGLGLPLAAAGALALAGLAATTRRRQRAG
ncbi:MAG TPA: penicillin acylase family protein [Mycobacteriales bacterium]|nr:penicillin acylase family protein [Mycobacteriales bacterium]